MKNILRIALLFTVLSFSACETFLGDNVNPNNATSATPQLVMPNALVRTASLLRSYNSNAGWIIGYTVNAGGYGGWGSIVTYNYTTGSYATTWESTYDDLINYQYIEDQTAEDPSLAYFNGVAKVMKAYDFHMLVDVFGNVPYTEGLKGSDNVTPAYDSQEAIYQDLVEQLDLAIASFTTADLAQPLGSADVMFGGDVTRWAKFANTLKLRLLMRMSSGSSTSSYAMTKFGSFDTSVGFLTEDAIVNPGYLATAGKQNPYWETYHTNASGSLSGGGRQAIPSDFVYAFYNGTKISDEGRGSATYRAYPTGTPKGVLGNLVDNPAALSNQTAWYVGTGTGANASTSIGLLKGRKAGVPMMLAAESYLLQAEAYMKGYLSGDDMAAFENGVIASFKYLYKGENNQVEAGMDPAGDFELYKEENADNYLVNYSLADTDAKKLEAIITQKYIALNFIHGQEAWAEFRRTGYPAIVEGSNDPNETFASILSSSPRPDELPVRFLYPDTEFQLNPENVPSGINQFSSLIFWQAQ
ncbi:SusD/RagB family nutrient-binding outer membrane lipoprotein [Algoriphagus pacificus]|uniref:SusD/RagB family nutrient-binding outer membrane lipoprotein n=1 Tax=Algoriphagus pacificus TaxID=2811234 RepID=A0ABS3CJI5_9BACT|nr:SusD/RagB family nutrient-binding outer membrane lipoprotein [Algoriphagus pacificus]MBN7817266.1 SusD/RagB family nutrient-binding outer membrane lipoprotein [Algoriphagus pacificus]